MTAAIVLVSLAFGLGVLLLFDGFTRERYETAPRRHIRITPPALGAVIGGMIALVATGWGAAALTGAVVGGITPRAVRRRRTGRLRAARREALAEVSGRLRDAVRAGLGLTEGLTLVAQNAPDAIEPQLRELAAESRIRSLRQATGRFAAEMEDPLADLFARALALADRLGSSGVTEVLDGLADTASQMAHTAREVRARQLRQKVSARIVAAVPVILLVAIRFTNPDYLKPYSSAAGQGVLLFGLGLIAAGYWSMAHTARLPEPQGGAR
jgi:Flp pilus assembly protein TadB